MKTQMLTLAIVAAAFAATAQAARLRGASTTLSGCGCTCRCTGAACQFATDAAFAKGCADPSLRAKYGVKEGDSCTQLSTLANKMQSVVTFSDCAGTVDFPPTSASAGSAPLPLMPGPVIPTYGGAVLPPPFMPMPGPVVLPDAKTAVCGCICPGAVCEAIHKCTPAARAAQLATCGVDANTNNDEPVRTIAPHDECTKDSDCGPHQFCLLSSIMINPNVCVDRAQHRRQLFQFWKAKTWEDAGKWFEGIGKNVACPVMKAAAKIVVPGAAMVTSEGVCVADDAAVAGACEVAGGGPEDPASDVCASALATAMEVACEAALHGGFDLTADVVVEHLGC